MGKSQKHKTKTAKKLKVQKRTSFEQLLFWLGNPLYKILSLTFEKLIALPPLLTKFSTKALKPIRILPAKKVSKKTEKQKKQKREKSKGIADLIELIRIKILKGLGNFVAALKIALLKFILKVFLRRKAKSRKYKILLGALVTLGLLMFIFWFEILKDLPQPDDLATREVEISTKIYDRNGELLFKIYKDKNRSLVKLPELPNSMILATLAAEDAEFYQHFGFSVRGIIRALRKNIATGSTEGGSTITQQLVKNALLTPEKSIKRKVKEIVLAVLVETKFSKGQILEMYLNEVSYGGTAYGVEEAAQLYFGKSAKDVNLAEAALLAGIPKSPSKYSPFGQTPEDAFARQKEVLYLMQINNFITQDQETQASTSKITFAPNRIEIKAPHFVMYTRDLLEQIFGKEALVTSGMEVYTTLDLKIQEVVENAIRDEVANLRNLNVTNASAIVVNPENGEILAMVGSVDYFDTENSGNVNVLLSERSPGSAIKVLTYTQALSEGLSPASILSDSPITFRYPNDTTYSPKNYDGKFLGKLTLRSAFAQSRNVPAVRTVANLGIKKIFDLGQKLGITSWKDINQYGLSITLGGANVKLIDLAHVYSVIANKGKEVVFTPFEHISSGATEIDIPRCLLTQENLSSGRGFSDLLPDCQRQLVDQRVAFLVTNILSDNQSRSPAFGRFSQLVIPNHPEVAVKTGTSNELRDNVTVGYSQNLLVAVWVGNNDNSPMSRIASGLTGASTIWNRIMSTLLSPATEITIPEGVAKISICPLTGTLPCSGCPTTSEYFLTENIPTSHCSSLPSETNTTDSSQILEGASTTN